MKKRTELLNQYLKNKPMNKIIETLKTIPPQKIVGYILLTPPLYSVMMFFTHPPYFISGNVVGFQYNSVWTGVFHHSDGVAYMSALPFYLGLMAITGAYLIKDKK